MPSLEIFWALIADSFPSLFKATAGAFGFTSLGQTVGKRELLLSCDCAIGVTSQARLDRFTILVKRRRITSLGTFAQLLVPPSDRSDVNRAMWSKATAAATRGLPWSVGFCVMAASCPMACGLGCF